ncbi:hypothetical protein LVJ94_35200 [Pendulispora rubella]|uniref:4'-phosphopantetheinyl transferase n=1 Tax=Pendulispora rubella TaxID=2741070 RepID=A0ABZ2KUA7_9BACT
MNEKSPRKAPSVVLVDPRDLDEAEASFGTEAFVAFLASKEALTQVLGLQIADRAPELDVLRIHALAARRARAVDKQIDEEIDAERFPLRHLARQLWRMLVRACRFVLACVGAYCLFLWIWRAHMECDTQRLRRSPTIALEWAAHR